METTPRYSDFAYAIFDDHKSSSDFDSSLPMLPSFQALDAYSKLSNTKFFFLNLCKTKKILKIGLLFVKSNKLFVNKNVEIWFNTRTVFSTSILLKTIGSFYWL